MNKKSKEWKTIINISSTAAKFGGINFTHYAPTKAALENLTYGLSRELSENKIRVVNVAPGIIDTRNLKIKSSKADFQKIIATIPNKRLGSPKDVANLIEFLIDEKSNYINGTTITISGGR
jgi:NAD(P)-dependent dehydrogenase (short-subunit alcohol dehydrogenase family)